VAAIASIATNVPARGIAVSTKVTAGCAFAAAEAIREQSVDPRRHRGIGHIDVEADEMVERRVRRLQRELDVGENASRLRRGIHPAHKPPLPVLRKHQRRMDERSLFHDDRTGHTGREIARDRSEAHSGRCVRRGCHRRHQQRRRNQEKKNGRRVTGWH